MKKRPHLLCGPVGLLLDLLSVVLLAALCADLQTKVLPGNRARTLKFTSSR